MFDEVAETAFYVDRSWQFRIDSDQPWDPDLIHEITAAISDEIQACSNMGKMDPSIWSPNINILRDPRWGRNDEVGSEVPYLSLVIAVAYVSGMQGDHPKCLKSILEFFREIVCYSCFPHIN